MCLGKQKVEERERGHEPFLHLGLLPSLSCLCRSFPLLPSLSLDFLSGESQLCALGQEVAPFRGLSVFHWGGDGESSDLRHSVTLRGLKGT